MKKLILTSAMVAGLAAGAFAQGTTIIDNTGGKVASGPTATDHGAVFFQATPTSSAVAITTDFNVALLAGTSLTGTFNQIGSLVNQSGTIGAGNGTGGPGAGLFTDMMGTTLTAPTSGTGFFVVEAWYSPTLSKYATFTAAQTAWNAGATDVWIGQSAAFSNPLGAGIATPPSLDNMPAFTLVGAPVPEPSSFALAGLGAAAMLIFRRRK